MKLGRGILSIQRYIVDALPTVPVVEVKEQKVRKEEKVGLKVRKERD